MVVVVWEVAHLVGGSVKLKALHEWDVPAGAVILRAYELEGARVGAIVPALVVVSLAMSGSTFAA